jgi:prepilin-type N-terminal cleavage/methylation domain-containing protein
MAPAPSPTRTDTAAARAGFTIMELMIVLVIVGIMAMTVAPSLSEVLSNNRHASAAMDLVRFARRARSQSIATSKAQLVRYESTGSNKLGRLDVFTGINNRCRQTPWADAITRGSNRAMAFDMVDYNPTAPGYTATLDDTGRQVIALIATNPGSTTALDEVRFCYQPDGLVFAAYIAGDPLRVQTLGVEFRLRRTIDRVKHGADRVVVFPVGGSARMQ